MILDRDQDATDTLSGSLQHIDLIPDELKERYRTVWEIDPKTIIDMAADRAPYIDQSQSMSLSIAAPTTPLLVRIFLRPRFLHSLTFNTPDKSAAPSVGTWSQDGSLLSSHDSALLSHLLRTIPERCRGRHCRRR